MPQADANPRLQQNSVERLATGNSGRGVCLALRANSDPSVGRTVSRSSRSRRSAVRDVWEEPSEPSRRPLPSVHDHEGVRNELGHGPARLDHWRSADATARDCGDGDDRSGCMRSTGDNAKSSTDVPALTPERATVIAGQAQGRGFEGWHRRPVATRMLVFCLQERGYAVTPWVPMSGPR